MRRNIPHLIALFFLFFCGSRDQFCTAQIVITEIMPAPRSGEAEWIELQNCSPQAVDLQACTVHDRTRKPVPLIHAPFLLQPGAIVVCSAGYPLGERWSVSVDSVLVLQTLPSLNNSGDDIVLCRGDGTTLDSLSYTSSWLDAIGVSLERIRLDGAADRENWTSCRDASGATPGKPNSTRAQSSAPTVDRYAVIINEIMFEPMPEYCEWVELFNRSDTIVDLSSFALAGAPASSGTRSTLRFPDDIPALHPGHYAIVAADSSILPRFPGLEMPLGHPCIILGRSSLGLGNTGDEILLLDKEGSIIDSMAYDANWHHPFFASTAGRSLELIHPSLHEVGPHGWGSCTDPLGGTPGMRNSIHSIIPPEKSDGEARLSVSPLPFSPDGDGYEDYCIITCTAPTALSQARLRLFDVNGRMVRTLINNAPMGRRFAAVWDGLDDDGRRVRIGPYIALLEVLDPSKNMVSAIKGIVVVAMQL
jgi:hypothetical protein